VLNIVVLGLVVLLEWGFQAVVIAYACQAIGFGVTMVALSLGEVRLRLSFDLGLLKQILRWALPLGGAFIVGSLYYRIDLIILSELDSEEAVGIYGLAYRFVDTLIVLPAYVMLTLLPEFSRLTEQRGRTDELMQTASTVMQVAVVPLVVFFVAFAGQVTELIGGSEFADSARVLQVLILGVGFAYIAAVFVEPLIAFNRQSWLFRTTSLVLVLNVALNFLLIPPLGANGAAVAFAISELVVLALVASLYRRVGSLPRPYQLWRVLAAASVMAGVAFLQELPFLSDAPAAVVLGVVGLASVCAYVGALYALRAVPRELHTGLVVPIWGRLRPGRATEGAS
jgi:O-antigen/teichoic acid export membrane protein